MPSNDDFVRHVAELLTPAGRVAVKRMFGGHGAYLDGLFMAIIADDELYLKCDDVTRAAFDAEDCAPFVYSKDGKQMTMNYRRAPGEAMDAPHLMLPWARRALEAAVRARAAKAAHVTPSAKAAHVTPSVKATHVTSSTKALPKKKPAAKQKSSRPAGKNRVA
jgi:DNA transformation protein and related proteins